MVPGCRERSGHYALRTKLFSDAIDGTRDETVAVRFGKRIRTPRKECQLIRLWIMSE
jgi:hypothetical protein